MLSSFEGIQRAHIKILNYAWLQFPFAYTQVITLTVHLYFLLCLYARQHLQDPNRASGAPGAEAGSGSAGTTPAPQLFKDSGIFYSKDEPWKFFTPDFYFPLFTLIEFFCYVVWLKFAEALLNPYGDDDQDFDVNFLIDRNLQVCLVSLFVHLYQQLLTSIRGHWAVISDLPLVIAFSQGSNIYHPLLQKSTFIPFKLH